MQLVSGCEPGQSTRRRTTVRVAADAHRFAQQFGDVQHAHRLLLPADQAVEVHQAGHVAGGEHLGAGLLVVGDAVQSHHTRDGFLVDGERAAEAAAFVGPLELGELDAFEPVEQTAAPC